MFGDDMASRAFDVFDDRLASDFACSSCMSHFPLHGGYDEPETLSYQITIFGHIGADLGQLGYPFCSRTKPIIVANALLLNASPDLYWLTALSYGTSALGIAKSTDHR
jgi:hypothetical protein